MRRSPAEIVREYGPFPGVDNVGGVSYDGEHVWVFTHQAVIMAFRYVLEGLEEEPLLDIDREVQIGNCTLTRFARRGEFFELETFADTCAVDEEDAEVTHEESA